MAKTPYRHELVVLDPTVVPSDDETRDATISSPVESVEHALKRIGEAEFPNAECVLEWATHPDERVGMALLEAHEERGVLGRRNVSLIKPMLERQLEEARRTGVLWTPILDKIATMRIWYRTGVEQSCEQWVRELAPWIRAQTESAKIHNLLRFRADEIWETVALETATLNGGVFEALMSRARHIPALVKNKRVHNAHLDAIQTWILDRLRSMSVKVSDRGVSGQDILATLKALLERGWEADPGFLETLRRLAREEEPLQGDAARMPYASREVSLQALLILKEQVSVEELVEMHEARTLPDSVLTELDKRIRGHEELEVRVARKLSAYHESRFQDYLRRGLYRNPEIAERALNSDDPLTIAYLIVRDANPEVAAKAFDKLLEMDNRTTGVQNTAWHLLLERAFDVEQLRRMYQIRKADPKAVLALVRHRAAGPALWREIAGETRSTPIRKEIANIAGARNDEAVRRILLTSRAPDVVYALCADQRPEELPLLIGRLAKARDSRVLAVIRGAPDEVLEQLDMELLTPWLASDHPEQRMEAIILLGRFRACKTGRNAGPTQRRRRGA